MRAPTWVLVLALMLATAGCLGSSDGGSPTLPATSPSPVTDEPGPTPTPPSAEPTPPTPSPEPTPATPTPPPLPPKVITNQSFDFNTEGDPTGQSPKTKPTDAVPEGYATLHVNISIVRASPAPTGLPVSGSLNTPSVHVLDPSGNEVLVVKDGDAPTSTRIPAVKGTWTIRYQGSGTARASVSITATA